MGRINWRAKALRRGWEDPREMVSFLYKEKDLSLVQVADILNVSHASLWTFMQRNGIKTKPRNLTKGIPCPSCGELASKIKSTFSREGKIYRLRLCPSCKRAFTTVESITQRSLEWK